MLVEENSAPLFLSLFIGILGGKLFGSFPGQENEHGAFTVVNGVLLERTDIVLPGQLLRD